MKKKYIWTAALQTIIFPYLNNSDSEPGSTD